MLAKDRLRLTPRVAKPLLAVMGHERFLAMLAEPGELQPPAIPRGPTLTLHGTINGPHILFRCHRAATMPTGGTIPLRLEPGFTVEPVKMIILALLAAKDALLGIGRGRVHRLAALDAPIIKEGMRRHT